MSGEQYRVFYRDTYRKFLRCPDPVERIFEREKEEAREIAEFCAAYMKAGMKVAEFGCGPGGILSYFQDLGMRVAGVEPSLEESEYARKRGLSVVSKMLEEIAEGEISCDLAVLSRSLNHFADPAGALRRIREFISDGGLLYLRLLDFPAQCHFGWIWDCAQADHLYEFSPESASAMLIGSGYDVVKMEDNEHSISGWGALLGSPRYHMKILARKSAGNPGRAAAWPDPGLIKARIARGQRVFRIRRLFYFSTYRHWIALAVRSILGETIFNSAKSLLTRQKE